MNGRRDLAARLLAAAVGLLPPRRRQWGQAMRAELAGLVSTMDRLSFVAGCCRAVARQPAIYRRAGYPLLVLAVLVAGGIRADTVTYLPLRLGVLVLVAVLVLVSVFGRRAGLLGPVAPTRTARAARVVGYLVVAALTVGLLSVLHTDPDRVAEAAGAVPVFTVALATFLAGFLVLTSERSAADPRVLAAGAGGALVATAGWALTVVALGVIPAGIGAAVLTVAVGMGVAGWSARRGGVGHGVLAGLAAGVVGGVVIFELVVVLSAVAPAAMIPDLAPAALSAADDLAQSRAELQDPYVSVAFGAFLLAAALIAAVIGSRAPRHVRDDLAGVVPTV